MQPTRGIRGDAENHGGTQPGANRGALVLALRLTLAGCALYAAVFYSLAADGGIGSAACFGTVGFAVFFPALVLLGKLIAKGIARFRPLSDKARDTWSVATVVIVALMLAYDGYRAGKPEVKFARCVASPVPESVRIRSAYTYQGFNFRVWAFHFTVAPEDLPAVLSRRPYTHDVDTAGFNLAELRYRRLRTQGYASPPTRFIAVHRYRHYVPNSRGGALRTLYGNSTQTEFYAYGSIE